MRNYLELLDHVLTTGTPKGDRTGTGTLSTFGGQLRFDLAEGFPLMTTKRIHTRSMFGELAWLLRGDTNNNWLEERGIRIWRDWAAGDGSLGRVYGSQWRDWRKPDGGSVDQINNALDLLYRDPDSRRIVVNAWNAGELDQMALTPCHAMFQFYVANGRLSTHLYQRSADIFLGVPFNIASYAAMTHVFARLTGLEVGEFIHSFGDLHLYSNHVSQAREQLSREPRALSTLELVDVPRCESADEAIKVIDRLDIENFKVHGYDPHPAIKAPVAV